MTCGLLSGLLGGFQNNQVNTPANYYPSVGSNSGYNANTQTNHFSSPNMSLFGNAQSSGNNLIGQLLGGIQGGSSGNGNAGMQSQAGQGYGVLGSLLGGLATGVHHTAENLISATGLGGLFAPIDDAIIHPILWDPISMLTGYDVSSHPSGVTNVSNPLGVKR